MFDIPPLTLCEPTLVTNMHFATTPYKDHTVAIANKNDGLNCMGKKTNQKRCILKLCSTSMMHLLSYKFIYKIIFSLSLVNVLPSRTFYKKYNHWWWRQCLCDVDVDVMTLFMGERLWRRCRWWNSPLFNFTVIIPHGSPSTELCSTECNGKSQSRNLIRKRLDVCCHVLQWHVGWSTVVDQWK